MRALRSIRPVAAAVATACAALLAASPAAQAQNSSIGIPVGLQLGLPQGEFSQNVNFAGGIGGGILWKIGGGPVAFRADLGVMIYGSETRRVPLGGGALGLINVDVTTTNSIFGGTIGGQVGVPGKGLTPYLGGGIGFNAFTTSSSVEGSNSDNEPFASSTNSNDGTFAKLAFGGLYVPFGKGTAMLDLGVRHTWNGEQVRYLTPGDVTEDPDTGEVILTPRNTRADYLTVIIGVTFTPGRRVVK